MEKISDHFSACMCNRGRFPGAQPVAPWRVGFRVIHNRPVGGSRRLLLLGLVLGLGCRSTATGPPERADRAPGAARVDGKGVPQVWVPAGSFRMGTEESTADPLDPPAWARGEFPSERPAHRVRLTSGYWIDVHEVSNGEFQAFVDDGGYRRRSGWSEEGWRWLARQSDPLP